MFSPERCCLVPREAAYYESLRRLELTDCSLLVLIKLLAYAAHVLSKVYGEIKNKERAQNEWLDICNF